MSVLDNFYEGVTITDAKGKIIYLNKAQTKIDDLDPGDVLGRKVTDFYRVDEGLSPTMRCIKTGRSLDNFACFYRTRTGKVVNSIHNVFPLYIAERLVGTICFIRDYSIVEQTFETMSKPQKLYLQTFGIPWRPPKKPNSSNGTQFAFSDIIGKNRELLRSIEMARLAAGSPSSVMLCGETGTGKELFAQSIHNSSSRSFQKYVGMNCAAIPENLLEGILFGTSSGAFTGALDKEGLFERANGGTLLLDEVNSMPLGLQAKILRVIQEKKVRRVGSLNEIEFDIKIVSSVNTDPYRAIQENTLRPDLFYRLGVVVIHIPPLRERPDDLGRLVAHFLNKYNIALGKNVTAIASEVMDIFNSYTWPGNVRELEHVIEGAMNIVGDEGAIELKHLSSINIFSKQPSPSPEVSSESIGAYGVHSPSKAGMKIMFPSRSVDDSFKRSLVETLAENEIRSIRNALLESNGNAARAARKLGLSPQLLNYKMKKYKINRRAFLR